MPSRLALPVPSALRVGAAAAAFVAAALVAPGAASADQQSSVQAQIGALRAQLAATGAEVHRLTSGYTAAEAQARSIAQQAAVEQVQARRAAAEVARRAGLLKEDLVAAYVGGFSEPARADAAATRGDTADPSVRYGYLSIATSTMRDSVDGYRTAQLQLNSTLSTLSEEERAAQATAGTADRARQAALGQATAADARLGALESQLTILEDKAAAQRAAAAQGAPASAARAGAPPQGGPVNGGLVSLVRAQVDAPAPAPAPPAKPAVTIPPVTAPPVTAAPVTAPPVTAPPASSGSGDKWYQLRECESGDDYQANTGNGFYGAYQFSQQTWTDLGYPGRPDQEPPAMQDEAAQRLQAQSGWGQWPACSAALGLS